MFSLRLDIEAMISMGLLIPWCLSSRDALKDWPIRLLMLLMPWPLVFLAFAPGVLFWRYHDEGDIYVVASSIGVGVAYVLLNLRTGRILNLISAWLSGILLWGLMSHYLTFAAWAFDFIGPYRETTAVLLKSFVILLSFIVLYVMIRLTIHGRQQYLSELRNPDICHACSYDLRGSIESTHCPECGKSRA